MSKMNSLKSMSAYSQAENALVESDDPHAMVVVLLMNYLKNVVLL